MVPSDRRAPDGLDELTAWLERQRKADRARMLAQQAVRDGRLVREPCSWGINDGETDDGSVCGAKEVDAHHDDYDEPLGVRWLCRQHHARAHPYVKPVAMADGGIISWRRLRQHPETISRVVTVMKLMPDGERQTLGVWIPAQLIGLEADGG